MIRPPQTRWAYLNRQSASRNKIIMCSRKDCRRVELQKVGAWRLRARPYDLKGSSYGWRLTRPGLLGGSEDRWLVGYDGTFQPRHRNVGVDWHPNFPSGSLSLDRTLALLQDIDDARWLTMPPGCSAPRPGGLTGDGGTGCACFSVGATPIGTAAARFMKMRQGIGRTPRRR